MSSKHFDALEALFDSVEEEIGPACGPKTCEALGNARAVINEEHADREPRDQKT